MPLFSGSYDPMLHGPMFETVQVLPRPDTTAPAVASDQSEIAATDLFVVQAGSPASMAQAQQMAQQVEDGCALGALRTSRRTATGWTS